MGQRGQSREVVDNVTHDSIAVAEKVCELDAPATDSKKAALEMEKAEVEKAEVEKVEVEKAEAEKPEVEKVEVEKKEVEKAEFEKVEVDKAAAGGGRAVHAFQSGECTVCLNPGSA